MKSKMHFLISRSFLIRMTNVSDNRCRENKPCILSAIFFSLRNSCRVWDHVEKYGTAGQTTDDNIIRRTRFVRSITKATNTHSEHGMLIAFPWQQWFCERASMLCLIYKISTILALISASSIGWCYTKHVAMLCSVGYVLLPWRFRI
jgi:hypothetical protein